MRIFSLLSIFIGTQFLINLLPGDPVTTLLDENSIQLSDSSLREELGLNRSASSRIFHKTVSLIKLDLGRSLISRQPVKTLLWSRFLETSKVMILVFLLSLSTSLLISFFVPFSIVQNVGVTTMGMPLSWLGPILILFFAVLWPIFELNGGLALPVFTLSILLTAQWSRILSVRIEENTSQTSHLYKAILFAKSIGMNGLKIKWRYGLFPSLPTFSSYLGTQLGALLSGSFILDILFNRQGLGQLMVTSTLQRDFPVIEWGLFFAAVFVFLGSALGELIENWLTP